MLFVDLPVKLRLGSEMKQEPNLEPASPEVTVELSNRNRMELIRRLYFDDKFPIHNHVESLNAHLLAFIYDLYRDFASNTMPTILKLALH